jgi:ABC-type multidrug transport system fused ATPase/permease subunit
VQLVLAVVSSALSFVPRLALLRILRELEDRDRGSGGDTNNHHHHHQHRVWLYVAILGVSGILANVVTTWKLWVAVNVITTRVYAQLISTIYDKSMRLRQESRPHEEDPTTTTTTTTSRSPPESSERSNQSIVNSIANEAKGIAGFVGDSYQLLETPLKLIACGVLLLQLLGWQSLLAGFSVVVLVGAPAQGYFIRRMISATRSMTDRRDARMSSLAELLLGVRQVKFLGQERAWEARIAASRAREVLALAQMIWAQVLLSCVYLAQPVLVLVVILGTYAFTHAQLSASTAFTSITVLALLEQALDTLPSLQMRVVNFWFFVRRMDEFFRQPERRRYVIASDCISLEDATIVPPGAKAAVGLRGVNLQFPHQKLSVVTGSTGVGKSLLLACLVGESELVSGSVRAPRSPSRSPYPSHPPSPQDWVIPDTVAYVPQVPWIEAGTVRDNILFGSPYSPPRYHAVLSACALHPDLKHLTAGDLTPLGGNGVDLSGGQKSRLALARALYSRAQTLIMDDIFSAVDVHTAKHLCEHALTGPLTLGRTRVLATYLVELALPWAEYMVVIDLQGRCQGQVVSASQQMAAAVRGELSGGQDRAVEE